MRHLARAVFARKGYRTYGFAHAFVAVGNKGVDIIAVGRIAVGPGQPRSRRRVIDGMYQCTVAINLKPGQCRQRAAVNIVCWRGEGEYYLSQTCSCSRGRKERNLSRSRLRGDLRNLYFADVCGKTAYRRRIMEAHATLAGAFCRKIILGCNAAEVEQQIPVKHAVGRRIGTLSKANGQVFALRCTSGTGRESDLVHLSGLDIKLWRNEPVVVAVRRYAVTNGRMLV